MERQAADNQTRCHKCDAEKSKTVGPEKDGSEVRHTLQSDDRYSVAGKVAMVS